MNKNDEGDKKENSGQRDPSYTYTELTAPGASHTSAEGINETEQVVGFCLLNAKQCGFIRSSTGQWTTISVPGAEHTYARGINNAGQVVGSSQHGNYDGFLWDNGQFTTIQAPNAYSTLAAAINDHGQIAGMYSDNASVAPSQHGFFLDHGQFTRFDHPTGGNLSIAGLDNDGRVTGYYSDSNSQEHGFIWHHGAFTEITNIPAGIYILPLGTSSDGTRIVGQQNNATRSFSQGFLMDRKRGAFLTVHFPGALLSHADGINSHGTIVGLYTTPVTDGHRGPRAYIATLND